MRNLSKKAKTIIAGAAIAGLASTGVAYAYWTTTGSGSGTAATSAGTANLTVAGSSVTNMYPGDTAQDLTALVTNNAANSVRVIGVTVSFGVIHQTVAGAAAGTCTSADYTLVPDMTNVPTDLAGGGFFTATGATIKFNNNQGGSAQVNQDGCKGATVHLVYTVS